MADISSSTFERPILREWNMETYKVISMNVLLLFACLQCAAQEQRMTDRELDYHQDKSLPLTLELHLENKFNNRNLTLSRVRYKRITPFMFRVPLQRSSEEEMECASEDEDFPSFLTPEQRKNGGIILYFLIGIYCFTLLARLCDKYFLPCVEIICETLNLTQDVAAATFMAMATSAPELFINIIGTFVTESDIGIGTIVGSSIFNSLGVAALGSLFAASPIQVDWWPVTRDIVLYISSISLLVVMTWDSAIFWYEALIMFIVYFFYFVVMFNNKRISKCVKHFVNTRLNRTESSKEILPQEKWSYATRPDIYTVEEAGKSVCLGEKYDANKIEHITVTVNCVEEKKVIDDEKEEVKTGSQFKKLCQCPEGGCFKKVFFIYMWPIKLLLYCTVPNPKIYPKLFPMTFLLCIVFIGGNSYVISWMITVIGKTLGISDSLLGLTLLAAGGCLPEAMSIILMSLKGEGSMGVSNALGANTMNILLSLGFPWFIKTMILRSNNAGSFLEIQSGSLEYTILGLITVAVSLYLILYFNGFKLSRRIGIVLILVYASFLAAAVISELYFNKVQNCL